MINCISFINDTSSSAMVRLAELRPCLPFSWYFKKYFGTNLKKVVDALEPSQKSILMEEIMGWNKWLEKLFLDQNDSYTSSST